MDALYTAVATSVGGRSGRVKSSDGLIDFQLSVPEGMGGPGGNYTNPEQMFAATYAACFNGAVLHVAKIRKVAVESVVTAKVSVLDDNGGHKLAVELDVDMPGVDRAEAEKILQAANRICPYSKATRNNIELTLKVTGK